MPIRVACNHVTEYKFDRFVTLGPAYPAIAPGTSLPNADPGLLTEDPPGRAFHQLGNRTLSAITWRGWSFRKNPES